MIHFVVALQCEARPLIARYRLQGRSLKNGFRIYERDDVRLIVAGVGKAAAAAATAYLQAATGDGDHHVWLNLGVAGHRNRAVGDGILAHKITDAANGYCWYPPLIATPPRPSDMLITVDQPATAYDELALYDMEAAAFYATATRFSSAELVQCYKVVSDNRQSPATDVSEQKVSALIERNTDAVAALATDLSALAAQLAGADATPPVYEDCLRRWRFSAYERNQLRRLLQRWQALAPAAPVLHELAHLTRGRDVITFLEGAMNSHPVRFGGDTP